MLEYIYGFDYELGPEPKPQEKLQWLRRIGLHVEICLAADKFGISGLEEIVRERMTIAASYLL